MFEGILAAGGHYGYDEANGRGGGVGCLAMRIQCSSMAIVIPQDQLQPDILRALIEEFVTRDGAVHGHTDTPLTEMVQAIYRQLTSGKVVIIFDEETESCTIVPKEQVTKVIDPTER
jgi:uncharacterized protein YheU (UPF0270 family)